MFIISRAVKNLFCFHPDQPLHAEDEYSSPFIAASYVKWLEGAGARVVVGRSYEKWCAWGSYI